MPNGDSGSSGLGLGLLTRLMGLLGGAGLAGGYQARGSENMGGAQQSKIAQVLSDPQVLQSLAGALKGIGSAAGALDKMPPEVAQAIQQGTEGAAQPAQRQGPYLGDAVSGIPPELALQLLRSMGIPTGFTPMGGGR